MRQKSAAVFVISLECPAILGLTVPVPLRFWPEIGIITRFKSLCLSESGGIFPGEHHVAGFLHHTSRDTDWIGISFQSGDRSCLLAISGHETCVELHNSIGIRSSADTEPTHQDDAAHG